MIRFTSPESLAEDIGASTSFIHATIGLDKGCLAKSETTLYFLGPRMGGWEIVEQTPLKEIVRVEVKSNFMGETTLIVCKSGRWQCKQLAEGVDIQQWLSTQGYVLPTPDLDRGPELVEDSWTQSDDRLEGKTSDDPFASEPLSETWDDGYESSEPETHSSFDQDTNVHEMAEEISNLKDTLEGATQSMQPLVQTASEVVTPAPESPQEPLETYTPYTPIGDGLSEGQDDEESGTSCIGTIVKWFVYIWLFGMLMDFCDSL